MRSVLNEYQAISIYEKRQVKLFDLVAEPLFKKPLTLQGETSIEARRGHPKARHLNATLSFDESHLVRQ